MPSINDGSFPYGSRVITIGAVTYIADNIEFNRTTKFVANTDENDEPNGGVLVPDFERGSATLQLAASTTVVPALGATFAEKFDPNDLAATTWYITEVGKPEEKGGINKVRISFNKKYN